MYQSRVALLCLALLSLAACARDTTTYSGESLADAQDDAQDDGAPSQDMDPGDMENPGVDVPPPEDTGPGFIDICENFCEGGYLCQGGQIFACADVVGCGSPCTCDSPVGDVCGEGAACREGERSTEAQSLCPESTCECQGDEDCPPGELCDGCACEEACGCASDADCPEGLTCNNCQCFNNGRDGCLQSCAAREVNAVDAGFCPVEYLDEQPCAEACGRISREISRESSAAVLQRCLEQDPLCFQSLEDCLFMGVYEQEPFTSLLSLRGHRFEVPDGSLAWAALLVGEEYQVVGPLMVSEGSFVATWSASVYPNASHGAPWFVDLDGDGVCTEADLVGYGRMERSRNPEAPSYQGLVEPQEMQQSQFCDRF